MGAERGRPEDAAAARGAAAKDERASRSSAAGDATGAERADPHAEASGPSSSPSDVSGPAGDEVRDRPEGALARAFADWSGAQDDGQRERALRALLGAARAELALAWAASLGASAAEALRQRFAGRDDAFQQVLAQLARVSGTELPVCIEGERGTGRSRLALAIHQTGSRRAGPFVVLSAEDLVAPVAAAVGPVAGVAGDGLDVAVGPDDAVGSGRRDLRERWAAATGGTLFVCGDGLAPTAQAELARLLEEPGAAAPRLVVALEPTGGGEPGLVPELAHRLRILRLKLAPLRADPDALRRAFLAYVRRAGGAPTDVSAGALERVASYGWPGNARQLEVCARRIVEQAAGAEVDRAHVEQVLRSEPRRARRPTTRRMGPVVEQAEPERPRPTSSAPRAGEPAFGSAEAPRPSAAEELSLDEHERRVIAERLRTYDWHQQRAAESLGIDRKTLRRKIQRYGLEPE